MSLLFLSLCSVFEVLLRNVYFVSPWIPLSIGFILLILSGILVSNVKKNIVGNSVCFFINSFALGLCIRAWYMYREFENPLWVMLLVSVACVIYLLIFYCSLYIPFFEKHINVYIWIFIILTVVGYIFVVCFSKTTYVSTFGYFVIIEIAFILAMCHQQHTVKHLYRDIVLSTYSVIVVAIIIALIMLGVDSFDGDLGFSGSESITSPRKEKVISLPGDI